MLFFSLLGSGGFRFVNQLSQRYGNAGAAVIIGCVAVLLLVVLRALRIPSARGRDEPREYIPKAGPPRFNG